MKSVNLCLLSVLALTAVVQGRGDLHQGSAYGAKLIYHETHEKNAIPLIKRDDEIVVKTVGNELVKAITVSDLKGDGESYIKRGGIGQKEVSIRIKSARGEGYKFLVEVHAL